MADVERLYGVVHGSSGEMFGVRIYDTLVAPSRDLMADILTLPQGSTVGIETCPELEGQLIYQGESFMIPEPDRFYWGRIKRLCERRGVKFEYLEDFETYKKYLDKVLEGNALYDQLRSAQMTDNEEEASKLFPLIYANEVKRDYIHLFDREEAIFKRIEATKPTIAIIGRGHSDPYLQDDNFVNGRFVVGEYRAETVFHEPWHWNSGEPRYDRAELSHLREPMDRVIVERELVARRYRTVTEGRVMAEGRPDYIGTWEPRIPAQGLFEIYLNPDGQTGRIEDGLGTASFEGKIWDGEVAGFGKRYAKDSDRRGEDASIVYEARFQNGEFVGLYSGVDIAPSEFRMRKFDGTPYPLSA